jgi:hypothetical protein
MINNQIDNHLKNKYKNHIHVVTTLTETHSCNAIPHSGRYNASSKARDPNKVNTRSAKLVLESDDHPNSSLANPLGLSWYSHKQSE